MADANKKTVTKEEMDTEISAIESDFETLQNQLNNLSVLESGSTKNYYFSSVPSATLNNKGTLEYHLYKIGNLCYVSFSHILGRNNAISSGATLYSEYITPQLNWGQISISETFNNITYEIESIYLSNLKKYEYRISIKTTLATATISLMNLTKTYLLT